jgi:hypothetical protein
MQVLQAAPVQPKPAQFKDWAKSLSIPIPEHFQKAMNIRKEITSEENPLILQCLFTKQSVTL